MMEERERIIVRILRRYHRLAKSQAALEGKSIGQWLEEAIEEKAGAKTESK